jgi:glycosyltransferase involved in cell wall biosynthesis
MTTVSVIIPTYNESATIISLLEKVNAQANQGLPLEVIVVDDGSKDNTAELLETRPDLYTHFVKQRPNQGKGAAVLAGLGKASGDYILFQDADLEYDPADYQLLFEPIIRFDADIVMGSRFRASRITRVSYYWHSIGNRLITWLFNILNNTTFTDIYSCYLIYRRSLVDASKVKALGWDQQAEILSLAVHRAKGIYEVPVNYYGRTYEEGKKIRGYHAISVIAMIAKKRFVV